MLSRLQFSGDSMVLKLVRLGLACGLIAMLVGCGGGTDSNADSQSQEVALSDLGISAVVIGSGTSDDARALLPGVKRPLSLVLQSSDPTVPVNAHPELVVEATDTSLVSDASGYTLTVQPSMDEQGSKRVISLKVVSDDGRRLHALTKIELPVAAVLEQTTVQLVAGNTVLGSRPENVVTVQAEGLTTPASVESVVTELPSGAKVFQIQFSRDVSGEGVKVVLPQPMTYDPYGLLPTGTANVLNQAMPLPQSASALQKTADSIQRAYVAGKAMALAVLGTPINVNGAIYGSAAPIGGKGGNPGLGTVLVRKFDCFINTPGSALLDATRVWSNDANVQGCTIPADSHWYDKAVFKMIAKQAVSVEYHTSLVNSKMAGLDWSGHEPVLHIHGFSPFGLGGGKGTWDKFPQLNAAVLLPAGAKMVPFEFHWDTNANFKQVSEDLARSIAAIQRISGKKVHLIAHSFGGVLVRTLLQGLGQDPGGARDMVASLTTLGTPHGGIFPEGQTYAPGQDSQSFKVCPQLSCWQMGVINSVLNGSFNQSYAQPVFNISGFSGGHLVGELAATQSALPAIPIHVGIGLTRNLIDKKLGNGDYLITFAGQRFVPERTRDAAIAKPLLKNHLIGRATVTEELLGLNSKARPGDVVNDDTAADMPTQRTNGYLHSSSTGVSNMLFWSGSDGGRYLDHGLESAPSLDCDLPITCKHAGFILFQQMVAKVYVAEAVAAANQMRLASVELIPNPAATMTAAQRSHMTDLLASVKSKGVVLGGHVFWDLLSDSDLKSIDAGLAAAFQDTDRVTNAKSDYLSQMTVFSDFRLHHLQSANKFMVVDKENALKFLKIGADMAQAGLAATQIAYPAVGRMSDLVGSDPLTAFELQQMHPYATFFLKAQPFLDFMASCPSTVFGKDWQAAAQKVVAGTANADDVLAFAEGPVSCIAAGLDFTDRERLGRTVALLKTGISFGSADSSLKMAGAVIEAGQLAVEMLPSQSDPVLRLKGVLDLLGAYVDAVVVGQEIASHTGAIVSADQDRLMQVLDKLDAQLVRQRSIRVVVARTAGLYVAQATTSVKVSSISCVSAHVGMTMRCTVQGRALPDGLRFNATGCSNITEFAGGTATQRVFTCTPSTVGAVAVSIADAIGSTSYFTSSYTVSAAPVNLFRDEFDGSSLSASAWNAVSGPGGISVSGSRLTLGAGSQVSTQGFLSFANSTLVVEAVLAGTGSHRDTHLELVDGISGDEIRVGDTDYNGYGVYVAGTGQFLLNQVRTGWPSTSGFKALRLTLNGTALTVERGDSLSSLTERAQYTLPNSVAGKVFYLRLGTGAADGVYSPGVFDWVRVAYTPTATSTGGNSLLPHTGITSSQCYKAGSDALVSCTSPEAIALSGEGKQDGMYADVNTMSYSGVGAYPLTSCVKDNVTGLIWEGKEASGTRAGSNTYTNYGDGRVGDASAYVAAVNALVLCGHTDWRLPTVDELQSIVDYGKPYPGPTINADVFVNTKKWVYWTSSPYAGGRDGAWYVYFYYGFNGTGSGLRSTGNAVRLVRASQ